MYIFVFVYSCTTQFLRRRNTSSLLGYITKTNGSDATRAPKRAVYTISDQARLQLPDNAS